MNMDLGGKQSFGFKNIKDSGATKWYLFVTMFGVSIWILLRLLNIGFVNYVRKCRFAASLPGPPALPIIGNAGVIIKYGVKNFFEAFNHYIVKYGTVFRFWAGPVPVIAIGEPEYIKEVLATEGCEKCPFFYGFIETITNKNLFVTTDHEYQRKRKMYDVFFSLRNIDKAYLLVEQYTQQLLKRLETKEGVPFDIFRDILVMTGKTMMDSSRGFNLSTDDEVEYYTSGLDTAVKSIYARAMKPWLYVDALYKLSSTGRKITNHFGGMQRKFFELAIEQRKMIAERENFQLNNNEKSAKKDETFLDHMLKLQEEGKLDDREMEAELTLLNASGTETSSLTLSFCFLMLAMHQDIQKDLYEELCTVTAGQNRMLTKEELAKCPLLERVIKESLRHVAPPVVPRITRHWLVLGKNLVIPPQTSLALCVNVMHKNPKYWKKPKAFYPDHFLPENVAARPPNVFIPFITGIRKCPGYRYAMNQLRVVVSSVILNYELTTDLKYEKLKFEFSLLMKLAGPYEVKIKKRRMTDSTEQKIPAELLN
ncbi:unnamed protein product [Bemisia tabaci]|uniref:Cytochrome P450 n=2 Tax=Bemisia tabaci TaxID=7038 RepID=A0A9P0G1J0_BEMTA|nr:unnamed protein product [Bemisia tabaci]